MYTEYNFYSFIYICWAAAEAICLIINFNMFNQWLLNLSTCAPTPPPAMVRWLYLYDQRPSIFPTVRLGFSRPREAKPFCREDASFLPSATCRCHWDTQKYDLTQYRPHISVQQHPTQNNSPQARDIESMLISCWVSIVLVKCISYCHWIQAESKRYWSL